MAVVMAVRLDDPMVVKVLLDADSDVENSYKPAAGVAAQDDERCIAFGSPLHLYSMRLSSPRPSLAFHLPQPQHRRVSLSA